MNEMIKRSIALSGESGQGKLMRVVLAVILAVTMILPYMALMPQEAHATTRNQGSPYDDMWYLEPTPTSPGYWCLAVEVWVDSIVDLGPAPAPDWEVPDSIKAHSGRITGWGSSDFAISTTLTNDHGIVFAQGIPDRAHCCMPAIATTANIPRDGKLVLDTLVETDFGYRGTFHLLIFGTGGDQATLGVAPIIVEWENGGRIELQKQSTDTGITAGNPCYSLEGAQYGVYTDPGCTALATTMVTNEGGYTVTGNLTAGTYYVKETVAPRGYALDQTVYTATVTAGGVFRLEVQEKPQNDPLWMWAGKIDADTSENMPQGSASLAGAHFEVKYYAGYFNSVKELPVTATRSWVFATDSDGFALYEASYLVNGDPFYYDSLGVPALPLGTVTVQEIKAPEGYQLSDDTVYLQQVTSDGYLEAVETYDAPIIREEVVRGGVAIGKYDAELNGANNRSAIGGGSLEHATFEIKSENDKPIVVEGKKYTKGQVVKTISTDAGAVATTGDNVLPFGDYSVKEIKAPEGYTLSDQVRRFSIEKAGIVDLTSRANGFENGIKRGDIAGVKVEDVTLNRMANIPFSITSDVSGESHIIVTDENGEFSTASSWNKHSYKTNFNDTAADGTYDPYAGIWFGKSQDGKEMASVNDSVGALPYGTYTVKELPCAGNDGKKLITFQITVTRDGHTIDLGTVTNDFVHEIQITKVDATGEAELPGAHLKLTRMGDGKVIDEWVSTEEAHIVRDVEAGQYKLEETIAPEGYVLSHDAVIFTVFDTEPVTQVTMANHLIPVIGTTAAEAATGEDRIIAKESVTIIDTVSYENLIVGKEYTASGVLMDKSTGEPLLIDGEEVVGSTAFTAETAEGTVEVEFTFDARGLVGKELVVFEDLYQGDYLVATHADIEDEGQTVEIVEVEIGTTAVDGLTGGKEAGNLKYASIIDTVSYEGLHIGQEYTVSGVLMDKSTGKPLLIDGEEVVGSTTFTAETAEGTVEVEFTFDARALAGTSVVVFETLYEGGYEIAVHADIEDEGQTVEIVEVEIGTTAVDGLTGEKEVHNRKFASIIDTVSYKGLETGREYTVAGVLMDKSTGEPLIVNGQQVEGSTTFVAEASEGTVEVEFIFDARAIAGTTVVVFESLYEDGYEITTHADIEDEGQTVEIIKSSIGTKAIGKATGEQFIYNDAEVVIVDTVSYENLIVGKEYTVTGVLMDKGTESALLIDGKEVVGTATFVAKAATGTVEVEFAFNASGLAGKSLVVFEKLYEEGSEEPVTVHEDINDKGQTVEVKEHAPKQGDAHDQTGNPLVDHVWAMALIALIGIGAAGYGIHQRVKSRKEGQASTEAADEE